VLDLIFSDLEHAPVIEMNGRTIVKTFVLPLFRLGGFMISVTTLVRWQVFQRLSPVSKSEMLAEIRVMWQVHWRADRPVALRRKRPSDNIELDAFLVTNSFGYLIVVDAVSNITAHLVVHEASHVLLKGEGYPVPFLPENVLFPAERRHWREGLGNVLHHPEIYRRTGAVYELPMDAMWDHQRIQSLDVVRGLRERDPAPADLLCLILFMFFWQFVPEQEAESVNDLMEDVFPDEYQRCVEIGERARARGLDLYTRDNITEVVGIVKEVCLEYCREAGLPPHYDEAMEELTVVCRVNMCSLRK